MSNPLFEHLRSALEVWIGWYRVPRVGPLDIMATAERIGIPAVIIDPGQAEDEKKGIDPDGLLLKGGSVLINSLRPSNMWPVTFGHEVGHWLLKFPLDDPLLKMPLLWDDEEIFCERFGRELALPVLWLQRRNCTNAEIVAQETKVDLETAFYQMWEAGVGREVQQIGTKTFCVWHGDPWVSRESPVGWRDCECYEMFRAQYGSSKSNILSEAQKKTTRAKDDIPF